MIRPWYRSWLFWLGLPGLVFLGWIWLIPTARSWRVGDSFYYYEVLVYPDALEFVVSDNGRGSFHWNFQAEEPGDGSRANPFKPRFQFQRIKFSDTGIYSYLSMRPWLPILPYLIGWLGLLALWQRRKARLSKTPAVTPS